MESDSTSPAPDRGLRREAVTMWRLQPGGLHCFVVEWPDAFWLGVECGSELTVSETLPDIGAVLTRADEIRATLVAQGWTEDHREQMPGGSRVPGPMREGGRADEV